MNEKKKIILFLILFLVPLYSFADSGDIIIPLTNTGYYSNLTLDDNNNIYYLHNDGLNNYSIVIHQAYMTGGTITRGKMNNFYNELANSNIYSFINYIVMLLFFYFIILGALIYGLIYGFRFYKPKKVKDTE